MEKQTKGGSARFAAVLTAIVLVLTGIGILVAPEMTPFAPTIAHADVFDDFVSVDLGVYSVFNLLGRRC